MDSVQQMQVAVDTGKFELDTVHFNLLHEGFTTGVIKPPFTDYRKESIAELVKHGFIKANADGTFAMRLAGVSAYAENYQQELLAGEIAPEAEITYFRCNFAERTGDGYDGVPIVASSETALNYVRLLMTSQHLSISDKTCAYDYAVLDFIDEFTGESHDLFPGDTVVSVEEGYVIHKFSE